MDHQVSIRALQANEPIPYQLLLLADEEIQAIERYIHASDIYVADRGHKVIGVCALYALDGQTAEIKAIAVDEACQNHGIGKRLLQHAEVVAREKGFSILIIGTPAIAEKQIRIYQKAGFAYFEIKKNFFITHYLQPIFENGIQLKDMVMLRKWLM